MSWHDIRSGRWGRSAVAATILIGASGLVVTAPAVAIAAPPAKPTESAQMTTASGQARASGKPVPIAAATTETSTMSANPDGSFTLTDSAVPVRRLINGAWTPLDATLTTRPDGSIGPKVSMSGLSLSAGGSGPLATMVSGTDSLGLTLPMTLPKPTLSGPTATYTNVLSGVDIVATADTSGGFSEVLVIHSAAAAANPQIAELTLATSGHGITMHADAAGNLTGTNAAGHTVVTAPAPLMWDSSRPGATARTVDTAGVIRDAATGAPVASAIGGPGAGARTARIHVNVSAKNITLTPDAAMMKAADLRYPVYFDPGFTAPSSNDKETAGWATVNKYYHASNYWKKTPDPEGYMQVGDGVSPDGGSFVSRSLFILPIRVSTLVGAQIVSATVNTTETLSWSCTPSEVDLYAPTTALTSGNATFDYWDTTAVKNTWGTSLDPQTVAYGHSTSCPGHPVGFNVKPAVTAAISANRTNQTFLMKAASETSNEGWKEFEVPGTTPPSLTIVFNHAPTVPTSLTTSPATNCTGALTTLGNGPISLSAAVNDTDGGYVGTTFTLKNHATGAVIESSNPQTSYATSGNRVTFPLDAATLVTAAGGVNGSPTQFDWTVTATDFSTLSTPNDPTAAAGPCSFVFNPQPAGQPGVVETGSAVVGQQVSFALTSGAGGGVATAFLVQLNAGAPVLVDAPTGSATAYVTPTRIDNTLTVHGVDAGSNIGQPSVVGFEATGLAQPGPDGDLTGDGKPDLVTVGGPGTPLPSGIWQAAGTGTGVSPNPVNIGINGSANRLPSDFDNAHVITGQFSADGTNLPTALVYYTSGLRQGGADVFKATGDGAALQPVSGQVVHIPAAGFDDQFDYTDAPIVQLVNAGTTSGRANVPADLIGVGGDDTDGYALWYYYGMQYGEFDGPYQIFGSGSTLLAPPSGIWKDWTLASAQSSTGGTALYLRNTSTGDLYLWSNLNLGTDPASGNLTLTHTQTLIKSAWNTSSAISAAYIDAGATADLWTLDATGHAAANLVALSPANIASQPNQLLLTADHTWALNNSTSGGTTVATATHAPAAGVTAIPLTGSGTVTWNTTDSLFNPDVAADGTSGYLSGGAPVNPGSSFAVAGWVKPTTHGGVVFAGDGTNAPAFELWGEPSDGSWRLAMTRSDVAGPTYDMISAGSHSIHPGVWTRVAATYDSTQHRMALYVDGTVAASGSHTSTWASGGTFVIGRGQSGPAGTTPGYLQGEVALVQSWASATSPYPYAGTDTGYFQPLTTTRIMDTRSGLGGHSGAVTAGSTTALTVRGVGGVPNTADVTAVVVNIESVSATTAGWITAYADGGTLPTATALNYPTTQNMDNTAVVPVGADGKIALYNATGSTQIVMDLEGYMTTDGAATGNTTYTPITATRLVDTRTGVGAPLAKLATGATVKVKVGGVSGIPTGVSAVALHLTTTDQGGVGYAVAYPDGIAQPTGSALNWPGSLTTSNTVWVPVSSAGYVDVSITMNSSTTDLVVDVAGYFRTNTSGYRYHAITPNRIYNATVAANGTATISKPATLSALNPVLVLEMTANRPTAGGYMIVYPHGTAAPVTSDINPVANIAVTSLVTPLTSGGQIDVDSHTTVGVPLLADCVGYMAPN